MLHNFPMFDWNDLRHFLAVARHGSTIAAAKALSVNQSTVHRRLDELEKRLGRQLVVRQPTGYKLTELGQDMLTYAQQVEEAVLTFERRLAASDNKLTGSIRLTCPEAVGVRLLRSPLIAKFNERYPTLRVDFVISDKLLDLTKGEADIAIRATVPYDEALLDAKLRKPPGASMPRTLTSKARASSWTWWISPAIRLCYSTPNSTSQRHGSSRLHLRPVLWRVVTASRRCYRRSNPA
jgi:DNA-binding transcriptional LysR family regulator